MHTGGLNPPQKRTAKSRNSGAGERKQNALTKTVKELSRLNAEVKKELNMYELLIGVVKAQA